MASDDSWHSEEMTRIRVALRGDGGERWEPAVSPACACMGCVLNLPIEKRQAIAALLEIDKVELAGQIVREAWNVIHDETDA